MTKTKLFVYDLLKSGSAFYETNLKSKVLEKHNAYTIADLYFLSNFSAPAICKGEVKIYGELLIFNDPDILKSIDDFEEYYENSPEISIYKSTLIDISYENGKKDKAFAYVMDKENILKYGGMKIEKGIF